MLLLFSHRLFKLNQFPEDLSNLLSEILYDLPPNLEKLPDSNLHQECPYNHNDSRKVSLQSVNVNLDFCHRGI